jgi:F-type H+-transporting ATPase subunit b
MERRRRILEARRQREAAKRKAAAGHGAPGSGAPGHGDSAAHAAPGHGEEAGGEGHGAGHCPGHGPTSRPPAINLVHGVLGVDNEGAPKLPDGVRPGGSPWKNWDWWKWRLTPTLWRYENAKDKCDPHNEPVPLLAPVINFSILVFVLFRFGRKPLREALKRRKEGIMKDIDEASRIKEKAEDRLDQYESDLEHLDDKLVALREQYAAEAADEKKTVVADAGEARDRMMADAEFRVQQDAKTARDELSREAMVEALAAAEALLAKRVTQADHDRLAEEYLTHIGPALAEHQSAASDGQGGSR